MPNREDAASPADSNKSLLNAPMERSMEQAASINPEKQVLVPLGDHAGSNDLQTLEEQLVALEAILRAAHHDVEAKLHAAQEAKEVHSKASTKASKSCSVAGSILTSNPRPVSKASAIDPRSQCNAPEQLPTKVRVEIISRLDAQKAPLEAATKLLKESEMNHAIVQDRLLRLQQTVENLREKLTRANAARPQVTDGEKSTDQSVARIIAEARAAIEHVLDTPASAVLPSPSRPIPLGAGIAHTVYVDSVDVVSCANETSLLHLEEQIQALIGATAQLWRVFESRSQVAAQSSQRTVASTLPLKPSMLADNDLKDEAVAITSDLTALVDTLSANMAHPAVLMPACDTLRCVARRCTDDALTVLQLSIPLVLEIVKIHHDALCVEAACSALQSVTDIKPNRKHVVDQGGITILVNALTVHVGSESVVLPACLALWHVSGDPSSKIAIVNQGCVKILIVILEIHMMDAGVVSAAGRLVRSLAVLPELGTLISTAGGTSLLLTALEVHMHDAAVAQVSLTALRNLVAVGTGSASGGIRVMLQALELHVHSAVAESCCAVLKVLVQDFANSVQVCDLGGVLLVFGCLRMHASKASTCEFACGALARLMQSCPPHYMLPIRNDGIIPLLLQLLYQHMTHAGVVQHAFMCLEWLSKDLSFPDSELLLDESTWRLLETACVQHLQDELCVAPACKLLWKLRETCILTVDAGDQTYAAIMMDALTLHVANQEIAAATCSAIYNLSHLQLGNKFVDEVWDAKPLLQALDMYSSNIEIVGAAGPLVSNRLRAGDAVTHGAIFLKLLKANMADCNIVAGVGAGFVGLCTDASSMCHLRAIGCVQLLLEAAKLHLSNKLVVGILMRATSHLLFDLVALLDSARMPFEAISEAMSLCVEAARLHPDSKNNTAFLVGLLWNCEPGNAQAQAVVASTTFYIALRTIFEQRDVDVLLVSFVAEVIERFGPDRTEIAPNALEICGPAILQTMENHASEDSVVCLIVRTFLALCIPESGKTFLAQGTAVPALMPLVAMHMSDQRLTLLLCYVMKQLIRTEPTCAQAIADNDGAELLMQALKVHTGNPMLVGSACRILTKVWSLRTGVQPLEIALLAEVLRLHMRDPIVVAYVCLAFAKCRTGELESNGIDECGCIGLLLQSLETHLSDPTMSSVICGALAQFVRSHFSILVELGNIHFVLKALAKHGASEDIVASLSQMLIRTALAWPTGRDNLAALEVLESLKAIEDALVGDTAQVEHLAQVFVDHWTSHTAETAPGLKEAHD